MCPRGEVRGPAPRSLRRCSESGFGLENTAKTRVVEASFRDFNTFRRGSQHQDCSPLNGWDRIIEYRGLRCDGPAGESRARVLGNSRLHQGQDVPRRRDRPRVQFSLRRGPSRERGTVGHALGGAGSLSTGAFGDQKRGSKKVVAMYLRWLRGGRPRCTSVHCTGKKSRRP